MITNCFEALTRPGVVLENMKVSIVHLDASPEFSIRKDDGKSFTSDITEDNAKLEQVRKEKELFLEVFKYCEENSLCNVITVNVQQGEDNYKPTQEIVNEIERGLKLVGIEL